MSGNLSISKSGGKAYYITDHYQILREPYGAPISSEELWAEMDSNRSIFEARFYYLRDGYACLLTEKHAWKETNSVDLFGLYEDGTGLNYFVRIVIGHEGIINIEHTFIDTGYYPCLVEGTPINMADGSEKPVEMLRAGELVLSYDPATNTQVPAVVIDSYVTGLERSFLTYSFSDGRWLTVYGLHHIYDKRTGEVKDIRKSTRDDQVVNIDGEIVQWAGTRGLFFSGAKKRRYNIVTSNNLYFANGILLGHKPFSKLQRALDAKIPLSEDIKAAWQSDCDIYNRYSEFINSRDFNMEMAECNQKRARSEHIIEVCKKRLADSDYKVQKYTEGLIGEEEWKESMDKRAGWRKEINEHEVILKENRDKYRAVVDKFRGGLTEKSMFEECCVRDNALFDKCKEYFAKGCGDK